MSIEELKRKFTTLVHEIARDGKIDTHDIPQIIQLMVLLYTESDEFLDIPWEEFRTVISDLVLSRYDESEQILVESILHTSFSLLELSVTIGKSKKWFCCFGKPSKNA